MRYVICEGSWDAYSPSLTHTHTPWELATQADIRLNNVLINSTPVIPGRLGLDCREHEPWSQSVPADSLPLTPSAESCQFNLLPLIFCTAKTSWVPLKKSWTQGREPKRRISSCPRVKENKSSHNITSSSNGSNSPTFFFSPCLSDSGDRSLSEAWLTEVWHFTKTTLNSALNKNLFVFHPSGQTAAHTAHEGGREQRDISQGCILHRGRGRKNAAGLHVERRHSQSKPEAPRHTREGESIKCLNW